MANKKKVTIGIVAGVTVAVLLLGSTFGWQSISQTALNEVYATRNPGGRLHDDFNDITSDTDLTRQYDKNVYVENFTKLADNGVQVYVRVRFDEYMERGDNAGRTTEDGKASAEDNKAVSEVAGAVLTDKSTWTTHIPGKDDVFHKYFNWDTEFDNEGKVTYLPTFNKNRDSLEADINGSFDAQFADYKEYTLNQEVTDIAIYDADDNTTDEMADNKWDVTMAEAQGYVKVKSEVHVVKESTTSYVIRMEDWLNNPVSGNFWVWDEDGWAYWANPISPDSATGLLLDGISRTETVINEDWYYGINVVAQFITADDLGSAEDKTGFYDTSDGISIPPSANAILLLKEIGVDVK